jgi:hypothetical protein
MAGLQRVIAGAIVIQPGRDAFDALHDQVRLGRMHRAARRARLLQHIEVVGRRAPGRARRTRVRATLRELRLRQDAASVSKLRQVLRGREFVERRALRARERDGHAPARVRSCNTGGGAP